MIRYIETRRSLSGHEFVVLKGTYNEFLYEEATHVDITTNEEGDIDFSGSDFEYHLALPGDYLSHPQASRNEAYVNTLREEQEAHEEMARIHWFRMV